MSTLKRSLAQVTANFFTMIAVLSSTPSVQASTLSVGGDWLLVSADRVIAPSDEQSATAQLGAVPVLNFLARVEPGDLIIAKGQVQGTDNRMDGSVGRMKAYLNCNSARISPIATKDLVRLYGNHHGAIEVDGFCKITSAGPANIQLMVRSDSSDFSINLGDQTSLLVEVYRPKANTTQGYRLQRLQTASSDLKSFDVGVNAPFEKTDLLTLKFGLGGIDSLIYTTGQGIASMRPSDPQIDMYGLNILLNNKRLTVRTENVVADSPRVSQNTMGWLNVAASSPSGVELKQQIFGANGRGLFTDRHFAKLQAMVFSQDLTGGSLKSSTRYTPDQDMTVPLNGSISYPLTATIEVSNPVMLRLTGSIAASTASAMLYRGECSLRLEVLKNDVVQLAFPAVLRSISATYRALSLRAEALIALEPGNYVLREKLTCRAGVNSIDQILLERTGTNLFIDRFE